MLGHKSRDEIRSIVERRGIRDLYHFTQTTNLVGILACGILSRRELSMCGQNAFPSDRYRLDHDVDAVSVSISRIDKRMFFSKKKKNRASSWVVLAVTPEILWSLNCRFSWRNAATNAMRSHVGWRGGPTALNRMFAGGANERAGLDPCYPTSQGAEVQVLEGISPMYISRIIVENSAVQAQVERVVNVYGNRTIPVVIGGA